MTLRPGNLILAVTAAAGAVTGPVEAQVVPVDNEPRVFLVTLQPGEQVWERFGHNAIWIHDPEAGTDIAYHYGLFDMSESGFMTRFLQGRMEYSMGAANALRLIDAYRSVGRDASIMELRLTGEQIGELEAFLEWNLLPENRVYRYDYFRDNCSTRIRDVLDRVLDGALRETLHAIPTPITFRSEAVSLVMETPLLAVGMDLGLGPLADQPITRWDLAFIPMRLHEDVRRVTVPVGGRPLPIVVRETRLPAIGDADEAGRVAEAARNPGPTPRRLAATLLIGLLVGTVFALAGHLASPARSRGAKRTAGRWTLAVGGAAWGLATGILGLILLGLWALTDHEFAHTNENLLQANPLALGLAVLVPLAAVGTRARAARILAYVLLGLSIAGLLLNPLPVTRQANLGIIALALPIHLGLALGIRRLDRR